MDLHSRNGRYPMYRDHMGRKERGTLVENKACVPVFPDDQILPYRICYSGYYLEVPTKNRHIDRSSTIFHLRHSRQLRPPYLSPLLCCMDQPPHGYATHHPSRVHAKMHGVV